MTTQKRKFFKKLSIIVLFGITAAVYAAHSVDKAYVDNGFLNLQTEINRITTSSTTYTAGSGINISNNNIISNTAPGVTYTAGTDISIVGGAINNTAPGITYTAGTDISIVGNAINNTAPGITYTAGTDISIVGNAINNTAPGITYTAGTGININGSNVISNAYTAGTDISIVGNAINNTAPGITYTAGTGININGSNVISNAYTAGNGISISSNTVSASLNSISYYFTGLPGSGITLTEANGGATAILPLAFTTQLAVSGANPPTYASGTFTINATGIYMIGYTIPLVVNVSSSSPENSVQFSTIIRCHGTCNSICVNADICAVSTQTFANEYGDPFYSNSQMVLPITAGDTVSIAYQVPYEYANPAPPAATAAYTIQIYDGDIGPSVYIVQIA